MANELPVDLLVRAADPHSLDQTCGQLPGVVAQVMGGPDGPWALVDDAYYVIRVLAGNLGFLKFAIEQQGYGTVVRELDELL